MLIDSVLTSVNPFWCDKQIYLPCILLMLGVASGFTLKLLKNMVLVKILKYMHPFQVSMCCHL